MSDLQSRETPEEREVLIARVQSVIEVANAGELEWDGRRWRSIAESVVTDLASFYSERERALREALASVPDPSPDPALEVTVTRRFAVEADDALMYWIVERDRAAGRFVLMDCPESTAREALGSIHQDCFFSIREVARA